MTVHHARPEIGNRKARNLSNGNVALDHFRKIGPVDSLQRLNNILMRKFAGYFALPRLGVDLGHDAGWEGGRSNRYDNTQRSPIRCLRRSICDKKVFRARHRPALNQRRKRWSCRGPICWCRCLAEFDLGNLTLAVDNGSSSSPQQARTRLVGDSPKRTTTSN